MMNETGGGDEGTIRTFWNFFYVYFLRYFLHDEVGHFWAIINCLIASFWIGFLTLYLMKPWGFTAWNRNLIKNKKRHREIAFRRIREEVGKDEDQEKLENRQKIVALSFKQLLNELQNGNLSAEDAVDAYRWKALLVNEKYNCVTEFIRESPTWARELDEKYKNKTKPPLFGVPFSVKENFYMKGYDCTCGLAKNIEEHMTEDCSFVVHLRSLGAVPIVRTNVPQTLLSFVCSNLVWGTTLNPHDIKRSPGGSSGGEGCLIAAGGCAFGTGSDIGGSLRIPAHFCGIVSLKPTSSRFKVKYAHVGVPGVAKMGLSYGFFAKEVETVTFLTSLSYIQEYFDISSLTIPIPFRHLPKSEGRLRIGYFIEDGWIEPVPACKRAVEEAMKILEAQGHELVPFVVPQPHQAMTWMMKAIFPDNAKFWCKSVEYEDIDPLLKPTAVMLKCPLFIRWLAGKTIMSKWPQLQTSALSYVRDLEDLREAYGSIDEYCKDFTSLWTDLRLDALVCPVLPFMSIPHEYPAKLGPAVFLTALFNMLDCPAGVVPITTVTDEDDRLLKSHYPTPADGRPIENYTVWDNPIYYTIREAAADSKGLPVGVQVVTLPYQEEKCLHVMEMLQQKN